MPLTHTDEAIARIRGEYLEMPGLSLTFWQAQRLWNLTEACCESALLKLMRDKFLMQTAGGAYVRRAGSPVRGALDSLVRAS
jgi:hypothetical protein